MTKRESKKMPTMSLHNYQRVLYWQSALEVVDAWSEYNDGRTENVVTCRNKPKKELQEALETFNDVCIDFGLSTISEDWCFDCIPDSKVSAKLRAKIQRRRDKAAPMAPLSSLL